jgi:glycosyltransferase involved in cell wall biosynthesis
LASVTAAKKLLFIVNTAGFFLSHRKGLALGAKAKGFDVVVAAPADPERQFEIEKLGFRFESLPMSRKGINPIIELKTIWQFVSLIKKVNPDVVHAFTLKPVVYSSLARWFGHYRLVTTFTGLGHVFTSDRLKALVIRFFVIQLLKISLKSSQVKVIFQNSDDQNLFHDLNILCKERSDIIPGTGVDTEKFKPQDGNIKPVVVFPARFLVDKGFFEMIEAGKQLASEGVPFELWLIGNLDPGNPSSATMEDLHNLRQLHFITKIEYSKEIHSVYAHAQVVCLPSYREGIPLALIEASACGRAIVTTQVPGCTSVVDHRSNGLLVPARDFKSLAEALKTILTNPSLREQMQIQSRKKALAEFDQRIVIAKNLRLYETV